MTDRQRVPYQTPPARPRRSPPRRDPDISLPGGGSSRTSHADPRAQRVSSSSGQKASSTKKGDPPKVPPGSRYAVSLTSYRLRDDCRGMQAPPPRNEALDVPPLRSMDPPSMPQQKPLPPPPAVPSKGKSSKGTVSKVDPPKSLPSKRKASDLSPPKNPTPDPANEEDAAPVIRSVSVGMDFPYDLNVVDGDVVVGDEEESSGATLSSKSTATAKVTKKKKIGPKQSSTVVADETEVHEEVTSPVNEEFAEDEEMSDGEERTDTTAGGTGDEELSPGGDNTGGPLPAVSQEFSFGRIYSVGETFDVNAAMGLASEFSWISPNDD
ncbi:wiskott-Aldrich syndrome protein homolog 1-like [Papaver somniferum]|uniref:wiskott-Aldrich syndrome protein homolog 1-like n=1 Tax=Papaver somniferum TaxID=3469 RepID=UPI000E703919|nr:wiskott-Aldrich syndrome protein homolog 1-like [Papaver somniferum]